MNLFVLDLDFDKNAAAHVDRHIVKLPIEAGQILCTAHWMTGGNAPYKISHQHGPIAKWILLSAENYDWTVQYAKALCREYTKRYGKVHKTEAVIHWADANRPNLPSVGLTPHHQSMPEDLRITGDAVSAYRQYYITSKTKDTAGRSMLSWKGRAAPDWIPKEILNE